MIKLTVGWTHNTLYYIIESYKYHCLAVVSIRFYSVQYAWLDEYVQLWSAIHQNIQHCNAEPRDLYLV